MKMINCSSSSEKLKLNEFPTRTLNSNFLTTPKPNNTCKKNKFTYQKIQTMPQLINQTNYHNKSLKLSN